MTPDVPDGVPEPAPPPVGAFGPVTAPAAPVVAPGWLPAVGAEPPDAALCVELAEPLLAADFAEAFGLLELWAEALLLAELGDEALLLPALWAEALLPLAELGDEALVLPAVWAEALPPLAELGDEALLLPADLAEPCAGLLPDWADFADWLLAASCLPALASLSLSSLPPPALLSCDPPPSSWVLPSLLCAACWSLDDCLPPLSQANAALALNASRASAQASTNRMRTALDKNDRLRAMSSPPSADQMAVPVNFHLLPG
jgi:hypothetical protein